MKIKALKAFTRQNDGELESFAHGQVYVVDSTFGNQLIIDGLAEEYTGLVLKPQGTKSITITENGTTTEDVDAYTNAQITVNLPSGNEEVY